MSVTGTCSCGKASWTLDGDPGAVTACNCTLCRRYGVLWAYDYVDERIHISGPVKSYVRAELPEPYLEILYCPTCACVLAWRGLKPQDDGRTRAAVNIRLAPPEAVASLPVLRIDGLADDFRRLPDDGRRVRDFWY